MPTVSLRRWLASTANVSAHIPYAGALALMLAAPFEQLQPVIARSSQQFTNLELVILIVLVNWIVWSLAAGKRPLVGTALTAPVLLLLGAMVVSALAAPAHQVTALLFTARFATGFLVYLLVVNTVKDRRHLVGLLIAAGLAGTVVAGLGILEHQQAPTVLEWLEPYRISQFRVGGELRISSTLQYPTIASMHLEMVFGLTLGLLLLTVSRQRWWAAIPIFVALVLIAEAIILTLSRSGLIVMAGILAIVGGLWLRRRQADRGLGVIVAMGLVIAGLLGHRLLSDSTLWLRLTTENDESWYRAQYQVPDRLTLRTGQVHEVDVTVTNTGRVTWETDGDAPFRLGYHWLDAGADEVLIFEGLRTGLPHAVKPGQSVEVSAQVQAPPEPGEYTLAWDVLQEGHLWFNYKGSPSPHSVAVVRGAPVEALKPTSAPLPSAASQPNTIDRRTLWTYAGQMLATRPLLGVGPDNFRLLYGQYAGLEDWDQGLHTNNMYIEFFVDVGLIGGVLFLWLIWRVLKTLRLTWQELSGESAGFPVFMGIVAPVTAFLLHGLVDFFFEFTSTYLMIWITLGLTVAFAHLNGVRHAHRI